jgi:hypothetical protein
MEKSQDQSGGFSQKVTQKLVSSDKTAITNLGVELVAKSQIQLKLVYLGVCLFYNIVSKCES